MKKVAVPHTYPIALERDVHPYSLVRSALPGLSLVLWRSDDGEVHVWEDNCPHRSVRLSAGRNLGACIEDIYHGWRFAPDGKVICIPAEHGTELPVASARVLSVSIASGLIWASTGTKAVPPPVFVIEEDEIPIRPLPFRSNASRVEIASATLDGVRILVTPTGETSATAYGFARRQPGATELETARRANTLLSAVRRNLEAMA